MGVVQGWFILDASQKAAAEALNYEDAGVYARVIDNPLANNLGIAGLIAGSSYVIPARILNTAGEGQPYEPWFEMFEIWPIHILDSDIVFLPQEI